MPSDGRINTTRYCVSFSISPPNRTFRPAFRMVTCDGHRVRIRVSFMVARKKHSLCRTPCKGNEGLPVGFRPL